jgi:hypothetical protein
MKIHLLVAKPYSITENLEHVPLLKQFLKKARLTKTALHYFQQLFKLLNAKYHIDAPGIANLTALADGLPETGCWLRADPIALQVDWVHIYMLGNQHLEFSDAETQELSAQLIPYWNEQNLQWYLPHPKRGYVCLAEEACFSSYDPQKILGHSIRDYLPQGRWLQIFNEIQMLLHQKTKADALWFWGQGNLPNIPAHSRFNKIISNDPVAKGLALLSQIETIPLSENPENLFRFLDANSEYLISTETSENPNPILNSVLDAWHKKQISEINIYFENGESYHLSKKRWWF